MQPLSDFNEWCKSTLCTSSNEIPVLQDAINSSKNAYLGCKKWLNFQWNSTSVVTQNVLLLHSLAASVVAACAHSKCIRQATGRPAGDTGACAWWVHYESRQHALQEDRVVKLRPCGASLPRPTMHIVQILWSYTSQLLPSQKIHFSRHALVN